MRVDCSPDDELSGVVVAVLDGLFDQNGAVQLWATITPHLAGDKRSVLIDLSGVDLMTSAGVGVLVRLLHRVETLGGRMALFGAGRRVREVIEVVRLEDILNVCGTAAEAKRRLESGGEHLTNLRPLSR